MLQWFIDFGGFFWVVIKFVVLALLSSSCIQGSCQHGTQVSYAQ